ncbi:MAG: hypothetical protein O2963_01455, partial [Proteobacteria bacterium]|nr:hypothetical protein [Pseudomonadota bacterium]
MFINSSSLKITLFCCALLLTACDNAQETPQASDDMANAATEQMGAESEAVLINRAMGIHERVIT